MTIKDERKALKSALQPVTKYQPAIDLPLDAILRRPVVEQATGLTTSALYRLVNLGDFPQPVQITTGTVGWKQSDIRRWIEDRPQISLRSQ